MRISYHRNFEKRYKKLRKHEQARVRERILLFSSDTFHPLLSNHALHGKYEGYRSINIGGNLRAIFKVADQGAFYFVEIGTHDRLYS